MKSSVQLDDVVEDFEFDFAEIKNIPPEIPLDPEIPASIPLETKPASATSRDRHRSNSRDSSRDSCKLIPTVIDRTVQKRSPKKRVPSTETRIIPTETIDIGSPIPTIGTAQRTPIIPAAPMETEPLDFDFSDGGSVTSSGSRDVNQSPQRPNNNLRKLPSTPPRRKLTNLSRVVGTPIEFTHLLDINPKQTERIPPKQFITANVVPVWQSDNPMADLDSGVDVFSDNRITVGACFEDVKVSFKVNYAEKSEAGGTKEDILMDSVHHVLFK